MFSTAGDTEEVPEPTSTKTEGSILGELSMAEKLAKFKSAAAKVGTDEMPVVFDRGALPLKLKMQVANLCVASVLLNLSCSPPLCWFLCLSWSLSDTASPLASPLALLLFWGSVPFFVFS